MCILLRSMKNPKHCADLSFYRDKSDKTVTEDLASSKIKGKRPGRPSSNISPKQRQERSRQSARECRSRKNLRYQYLEQLVNFKEKSVYKLRRELEMHRKWCEEIDNGVISEDLVKGLSIDQQISFQLQTADQSNIPLPIQRSISLPIKSDYQTSNLSLTSAQCISKSTKDSKLYKLLTGRISSTQSHFSEDTTKVFHSNRTQSLSSEDTSSVYHSFSTQSLSSEDTSNVRHQYTTESNYGVDSYNMLHQHNKTRYKGDTSNVYTQQQSGLKSGKLSSTCAPTEKQQTLSSFTRFDRKSQEQVVTTNNYKLDMHEQPSCISHFDNISFLSKGNNTNLARLNTNQSSDEVNIPKTHSDKNILSEASDADDTSSEMELVDWILQNQSNLSSDRALLESARQFGDTPMVDILSADQTEIADVSPAQFDILNSDENCIATSNNSNMTFAQTFQGNIKISDKQGPTTVASPQDTVLPSKTSHYKCTLPSMLNFPAFSLTPFHRSTSADFSQTPSSSRDTFVSQSHPLSGTFNPVEIPVTEFKSSDSSILHDVNTQFNQSRTSEDLKELRRQNVSLNNKKSVVISSASTNREIPSTSGNSSFARENKGEAVNTSSNHSLIGEIRPDSGANLKRSHSTGDTPHPNVQNRFPFLSFLLNPDDEI